MTVNIAAQVSALLDNEEAEWKDDAATLAEFRRFRVRQPRPVTVNFSGGIAQTCWTATRSNGRYSVLYLPTAGYFSLCMDSDLGPLDMGVHGPAIACFASV